MKKLRSPHNCRLTEKSANKVVYTYYSLPLKSRFNKKLLREAEYSLRKASGW